MMMTVVIFFYTDEALLDDDEENIDDMEISVADRSSKCLVVHALTLSSHVNLYGGVSGKCQYSVTECRYKFVYRLRRTDIHVSSVSVVSSSFNSTAAIQ